MSRKPMLNTEFSRDEKFLPQRLNQGSLSLGNLVKKSQVGEASILQLVSPSRLSDLCLTSSHKGINLFCE